MLLDEINKITNNDSDENSGDMLLDEINNIILGGSSGGFLR